MEMMLYVYGRKKIYLIVLMFCYGCYFILLCYELKDMLKFYFVIFKFFYLLRWIIKKFVEWMWCFKNILLIISDIFFYF